VTVRATYDPDIDMAYVYLTEIPAGSVTYTEALIIDLPSGRRLINLEDRVGGRRDGMTE
jgi:uncharacterized protein YuzE